MKIKGGVSLDDVAELTGLELPVDTYETLSGYIFGLYCTIPKDGSKFDVETDDLEIQVLDVRKHTVASCILTLKEKMRRSHRNNAQKVRQAVRTVCRIFLIFLLRAYCK